jgi:hypothetical protein
MKDYKNTWNKDRLEAYIGQEEHVRLEFKSSKGLKQDKESEKKDAINAITKEVVALINTDGGEVLIGIEEEPRQKGAKSAVGRASKIEGVSRTVMDAKRLNQMICDRISPATGSLVNVFPITLYDADEEAENLAFAIEVGAGNTAYQFSGDKIYYGRRGSESIPLDDKDVRLRMLSDDKPRVRLSSAILGFGPQQEDEYRNEFRQRQAMDKDPTIFIRQGGPIYVRKIKQYTVDVNIIVENSGNSVIKNLGASIPKKSLSGLDFLSDTSITKTIEGDFYYIEKDFLKSLKIPLYPQMKAQLIKFSFLIERDTPPQILSEDLRINVFLDGGSGDSLIIDLANIGKEALINLQERTEKVEKEFPEIIPG